MTATQTAPSASGETVRDGIPHLAYYHPRERLSFVWNGGPSDPIEVEDGGYGGPLIATLDASESDGFVTLPGILEWFQKTCDAWAEVEVLECHARELAGGDHYRRPGDSEWFRVTRVTPGEWTRIVSPDYRMPGDVCIAGNTAVEVIRLPR